MSADKHILFYDFETTGIPLWNDPSGSDDQPHAVQLAAKLVNFKTRKAVQTIDLIAKPDGWSISPELTEIHGITNEYAAQFGVPEKLLFESLFALAQAADLRVAHSEPFDARIQRIGMKRFMNDELLLEEWKSGNRACTMRDSKKDVNALNKAGKLKNPTLAEAYFHYTQMTLSGAHTAMVDVEACETIYFAMRDNEKQAAE